MSNTDFEIPIVLTAAGRQPTPPATLLANLIALVSATNPGYTANLPGSLIEDVSSTDVGALAVCDAAVTELINSLTSYGANAFLLTQLGNIYGVTQGLPTNTSVSVTFTVVTSVGATPQPGYVIPAGFTVSDGTNQYVVQDGGVVLSSGSTAPLFCVASQSGSWTVPANTVTDLVTSVPTAYTVTCTNLLPGTPGPGAETEESYRSRVLQAGLAVSTGMATTLKTLIGQVSGVTPRLVSVLQQPDGWEVIVGGGDPYAVAYAIWSALFDVNMLVDSDLVALNITAASHAVVTTNLDHGYAVGQAVQIIGATPSAYNVTGTVQASPAPTLTTFAINVDSTSFGSYTASSGSVSPNLRNTTVSIEDYPDAYQIPFVVPPQQTVTMTVTWNTSLVGFTAQAAVQQLGSAALAAYVNSIYVGAPMNLFLLQSTFQEAIASVLSPAFLTKLEFAVSINGFLFGGVAGITAASTALVTTTIAHGFSAGEVVAITGATPAAYNVTGTVQTVPTPTTFTINVNSSGFGSYTSGAVVTSPFVGTIVGDPESYFQAGTISVVQG